MAEWKKVIVSGSAAELSQLNVEPNQQISGSASDTFLSGSFSGSFQGDGSGITGVSASSAVSASYATSASYADTSISSSYATSASYADSTISSSYALNATSASYADNTTSASYAESASYADNATSASYSLNSTSASYAETATSSSYSLSSSYSETATSASYSDNSISASYANDATSASYALSSSYASTASVALSASYAPDTTFPYTGSAIISGSLSVTGSTSLFLSGSTVLSVNGSQGEIFSVTDDATGDLFVVQSGSTELFVVSSSGAVTISGSLTVTNGITASLYGTASWAQNALTASVLPNAASNGTGITSFTFDGSSAATVEVSGAAALTTDYITKWTGDAFANSSITDDGTLVTFANDALFQGDITVQGTASFQNTENLLVADRFVLFASGSNTVGDGGIVVQQGTQNIGELYGYDSGVQRWGFTGSFDASSTSYAPEAYIAAVVDVDGGQSDIAKYQKNGNIRISGSDIWIYA